MKHIEKSPIDNSELEPFLRCKDNTVSKGYFTILIDKQNDFLITSPRPKDEHLAKFYESEDYISHTNVKKTLFDRLYHLVRNYTLKKKLKLVNSLVVENKTILDIGAGTGDFLSVCKKGGWNIFGVEPNDKAKRIAESKLHSNLESQISDLKSKEFDIITMWHVLEHIPNLSATISNLKKLLKPKGTLIVAVPNYKSFDAKYYKEDWAAYDVPRHLWHFSKKAIRNLFKREKMAVVKIIPMKFDAYYVSLLSEKYKNGRINYITAFFNGLKSNIKAKHSKEYSSLIYIIKNGKN